MNRERAALTFYALEGNLTMVRRNDMPYETEAESGPLDLLRLLTATAVELFKDLLLFSSRNAHALILHSNADAAIDGCDIQSNRCRCRRVLAGIVQEISQRRGQRLTVALDRGQLFRNVRIEGVA